MNANVHVILMNKIYLHQLYIFFTAGRRVAELEMYVFMCKVSNT